ncbi:MAG TPA: hypothetical protein VGM31_08230 [Puia sp.]
MQRLATLSFLAVVLVLLAFTVHETKKPDLTVRPIEVKGKI